MYKMIATLAFVAVLLMAGCNKGTGTEATAATAPAVNILASAEASSGEADAAKDKPAYEPKAGTELDLGNDEKVMIVSVGDIDAKSADYEGLVAIEGRVSESYPDKASFILVDADNMKGCSSGCCPQAKVPVRVAKSADGKDAAVPGVDEMVIVVAQLTLTETGYTLDVRELRKVGKA
jgi:hypothetical protein